MLNLFRDLISRVKLNSIATGCIHPMELIGRNLHPCL